jgi:hypothetical protein
MSSNNRFPLNRPDHILTLVEKPMGWKPRNYFEKPRQAVILSRQPVASYEEAHDDLVRCNRLALRHSLSQWAIIETAGAEQTNGYLAD